MSRPEAPSIPEAVLADAADAAGRSAHLRGHADRDKANDGHHTALAARLGRDPTPEEWAAWQGRFWGSVDDDADDAGPLP